MLRTVNGRRYVVDWRCANQLSVVVNRSNINSQLNAIQDRNMLLLLSVLHIIVHFNMFVSSRFLSFKNSFNANIPSSHEESYRGTQKDKVEEAGPRTHGEEDGTGDEGGTSHIRRIQQISVSAAVIVDCVDPREVILSSREPTIHCGRSTRVEFIAISHPNTRIKRFVY